MTTIRHALFICACALSFALTGCGLGGLGGPFPGVPELVSAASVPSFKGPVAPPQITYRIDENRYFELVHRTLQACANAGVYYVDEARGIRSFVLTLDPAVTGVSNFTIDAANTDYLIGPVTRGNTDCSSGGGTCGGASMPYSVDAGRTWKRTWSQRPSVSHGVSGPVAYTGGSNNDLLKSLDLLNADSERTKWTYLPNFTFVPRKPPIDNRFHCTDNRK